MKFTYKVKLHFHDLPAKLDMGILEINRRISVMPLILSKKIHILHKITMTQKSLTPEDLF